MVLNPLLCASKQIYRHQKDSSKKLLGVLFKCGDCDFAPRRAPPRRVTPSSPSAEHVVAVLTLRLPWGHGACFHSGARGGKDHCSWGEGRYWET